MKPADINTNLVDSYYMLLRNLSPNNKLELIARLSNSLKTTKAATDNSWKSLYGALVLDQSADKFIEELKEGRHFGRESVDL